MLRPVDHDACSRFASRKLTARPLKRPRGAAGHRDLSERLLCDGLTSADTNAAGPLPATDVGVTPLMVKNCTLRSDPERSE